jgi:autotransporter-associated beta strand protein
LSGSGSIASTSNLTDNGTFSIAGTAGGASLISLSGGGSVQLGTLNLTLTNASGNFAGTISGLGGLVLAGGGETLSGSNSYTGITTIASGTLFLSNPTSLGTSGTILDNGTLDISTITSAGVATSTSIMSLSGPGAVTLGTKTLILTNAADTFSGTVSGSGGVTISGGTEILTGQNSYTGITTISGGSLALSGAGSLSSVAKVADNGVLDISGVTAASTNLGSLSGTGTVNLGSRSLNLVNASDTFSGTILGAGGLIVSGGTEILAGNNSYTGPTTIAAGTLQIGRGPAGGSITGDVADGGMLAFDRTDTYVFSGRISGLGGIAQIGEGTLVLTSDNSYSGGTTISFGTLQIGNGAASGAITGNVVDNGTFAFGRSDTLDFGGTISGMGGVSQVSGTTILTTVNSYTGATEIASGAGLVLSGAGSIASSGGIIDDGSFDVSGTSGTPRIASLSGSGIVALRNQTLVLTGASGTFSGTISGSGGITLNAGNQTLSGTQGYTGATTINGGTLAVNGSITASSGVTVNSGGALAGSGTVPSVMLNGGTIAPGMAGAGTLAVNGSVGFSSNSNLLINLSSAGAPTLVTSGAETIAGTLTVASTDGTYLLGQKLTVLTAENGLTGSFTLVPPSGTGAEYSSTLTYDADDVYLEINLAKLSPLLPADATANAVRAVGGIDAAIAAGDTVPTQFDSVANLSSATLASDASELAGQIGSDLPAAGDALFSPFMNAMFDHINDGRSTFRPGPQPQKDQIWLSGFAGSNVLSPDSDADGLQKLSSNASGLVGGADWTVSPRLTLGAALSAASTDFHLVGGEGSGKANAFQGGVYGLVWWGPRFYGAFAAAFSLDDITTQRTVQVSGSDTLIGKPKAAMYGGRYETGVDLAWLTPYLALEDKLFEAPAYTETAYSGSSDFALTYAAHSTNTADLELGIRQAASVPLTPNWALDLSDRVAWRHTLSGTWQAQAAFAALPDSGFTAEGLQPGKDSLLISMGADLKNRYGVDLSLHFENAASSVSQSYAGIAAIEISW